MKISFAVAATVAMLAASSGSPAADGAQGIDFAGAVTDLQVFRDAAGAIATHNANGRTDSRGAFFQSLGTNGRTCATCHAADQAMSISPPQIRERFYTSRGRDPLFAAVDGANCASANASDAAAHSLLLQHGLIRVARVVPASAQFTLSIAYDPYGCALVVDPASGGLVASVYRRPLPATNLRFLSAVMWDGRETLQPLTAATTFAANLRADLAHQAQSAISGHAQATQTPTAAQVADIVQFELGLSTAQIWDRSAGMLDAGGAVGGPRRLAGQLYYPGINDVLGADPTGASFSPNAMSLFAGWSEASDASDMQTEPAMFALGAREYAPFDRVAARRDVAAGEVLFNTFPIRISGVRGLNDNPALGKPASFTGNCTTCHDAPNVGDHSVPLPLDIGVGHSGRSGFEDDPQVADGVAELDQPDLPVFLVSGCPNPFDNGQPFSFYTTDPGKALNTGLCSDLNRVKGPVLRGLAARAPYFHNGAATNLLQAVNFYNQRFAMNLTNEQKRQLVAFLNSL